MGKIVEPDALRQLREQKKFSLQELADKSGVDRQTIHRLEHGLTRSPHGETVDRLCKALGATGGMMSGETPVTPTGDDNETGMFGRKGVNIRMSAASRNAMALVAKRFGVTFSQIAELAPYLFLVAAEQSLKVRRDKMAEVNHGLSQVENMQTEMPYLVGHAFHPYSGTFAEEEESIAKKDIFAHQLTEASEEYDEGIENPFVVFLRDQGKSVGVEFSNWYSGAGPNYLIGTEEAEAFVGGDADAARAIQRGIAVLADMPKELRGADPLKRAEWARGEHDKWRQENASLLEGLTSIIDAQTGMPDL